MKVPKLFVVYRLKTQKHEASEEINFNANVLDSENENLEEYSAESFHKEMQMYLKQCIQYHQKLLL
jgi:hypothetical protein